MLIFSSLSIVKYTDRLDIFPPLKNINLQPNHTQIAIGVLSFHVTADPLNVDHFTTGSLPICSDVVPDALVVASTGSVSGIGTAQELPLAPTSTLSMELASAERVNLIEGAQLSRAIRFVNSRAMLSWVIEIIGQVVLFVY